MRAPDDSDQRRALETHIMFAINTRLNYEVHWRHVQSTVGHRKRRRLMRSNYRVTKQGRNIPELNVQTFEGFGQRSITLHTMLGEIESTVDNAVRIVAGVGARQLTDWKKLRKE